MGDLDVALENAEERLAATGRRGRVLGFEFVA